MRYWMIFSLMMALTCMLAGHAEFADAKRFGMGSSFGKHRMISKPHHSGFAQQPNRATRGAAQAGQRGSARTGLMGMLGGLALGGLLGSLFFGGAFEGLNLFDLLVIGGVIFLVVMLLKRRAPAAHDSGAYSYSAAQPYPPSQPQGFASPLDAEPSAAAAGGSAVRPEIDSGQFIPAAKEIYVRMQQAWDRQDLDEIRTFCTPEIAERIGRDMQAEVRHHTEVVTLQAEIADSWMESDHEWVAVSFDAMLREKELDAVGATTEDQQVAVKEVWIFKHAPDSDDPTWYLAGIQQVQ